MFKPIYTFDGVTMSLRNWSKCSGISYNTLETRLRDAGWSFERAITTPVAKTTGPNTHKARKLRAVVRLIKA